MSIPPANTQTTPTYYEPATVSGDPEQHRLRVLIDEAATLRGLTIQVSLRLMALAAASTNDERKQVMTEFDALQVQFSRNLEMLFGTSSPDTANKDHIEWIRQIVGANTDRRAALLRVEAELMSIKTSLHAGNTPSFAEARAFFDNHWPVVRDKMTEVIWDLWADLDATKNEAVSKNVALQSTLVDILADIKKLSSAIRMVAINSAVLAARPQEAGAGFQSISQEVKLLSEEIDASTRRAKVTIDGLRS